MIGLIPKVLVDLIKQQVGDDKLNEIFSLADIEKNQPYLINKQYTDQEWQSLFKATLTVLEINEDTAYQLYAKSFINYAIRMFPTWFEMCDTSIDFLKLQPLIHNGFYSGLSSNVDRKKLQDKFILQPVDDNHLLIKYCSPNKLCKLYIQLAMELSNYYQDKLMISHDTCMLIGDEKCCLHVEWSKE
jgi:hypothetical protein